MVLAQCFVWCLLVGCDQTLPSKPSQQVTIEDSVDRALRDSRNEDALRLAREALLELPNDPERLANMARAMAASGMHREAAFLLTDAAKAADFKPTTLTTRAVRALLEVGELYPAIELLTSAVHQSPNNHSLRRTLFGLLGEAGRTDLMREHYEVLIRDRKFDLAILIAMTDTSERLFPAETIQSLIELNSDDDRLRLALAQSLRDQRRLEEAENTLRQIVQRHADFAPALALLGRMPGVQKANDGRFESWSRAASPHCQHQADYWIAMGDRHFQFSNPSAALSCYAVASRIDPNRVTPWIQASLCLRDRRMSHLRGDGIDENESERISEICHQRAKRLLDLRFHLQRFGASEESSQTAAAHVARSLNGLGRHWEAEAWSAIATTLPSEPDSELGSLRNSIIQVLEQTRDWSIFPDLQRFELIGAGESGVHANNAFSNRLGKQRYENIDRDQVLRFQNETEERGVVLRHDQYADISSSLIQTLGSGGGTLDYDLDSFPDLLFPGGGDASEHALPSTLLRNLGAQFRDVTLHARSINVGLGQSVAIGDFNEDGFPDVYFANFGENRLLRNNGDGTFSDASQALGNSIRRWTTGGAFFDFNGDGLSDLVAVNYCKLTSAVDQPCESLGKPAPCHPAQFPGDGDQLLIGTHEGTFREAFEEQIRQIIPGRGLGVVAGTIGGGPSILVANDMSANHLFRFGEDSVNEVGVPSGVAVDSRSLTQASMGIACGDLNRDLNLDFYVTGFAHEYNIFYEQLRQGIWTDRSARAGLIESSVMMVGFGTQAIDVDGDGFEELLVTNGHIGDFGPKQPSLEQGFQLLRRNGSGEFALVALNDQDPYFATNHVGRALWKIDVNRDLLDDVVITHQNAPPVLLVNQTETNHHRIAFRLVGTTSSRDAIGATITFVAGNDTRKLWLLSGDGYMCSNERRLHAGIGAHARVKDVVVTWPSGVRESFGSLQADQLHLLIEGEGTASQSPFE
ncbi:MAG: FG-GAP-like repeat-containing protein [Planctomycetota bacterium]